MGAASSTLPDEIDLPTFQALVADASPDVFEAYCNDHHTIPKDTLLKLASKADVFLSHDWGIDSQGRDNHARIRKIKEALATRHHIVCWFDEDQMTGDIDDKMAKGIDNSSCVITFITKRYMEKVNSDNSADNCRKEFKYACRVKGEKQMIPVVMEPDIRDTRQWYGPISFSLGGLLYVDCSSSDENDVDAFYASIERLYLEILKRTTLIKAPKVGIVTGGAASLVAVPVPFRSRHKDHLYMLHMNSSNGMFMAYQNVNQHFTDTVYRLTQLGNIRSAAITIFSEHIYLVYLHKDSHLPMVIKSDDNGFFGPTSEALPLCDTLSPCVCVSSTVFQGKLIVALVSHDGHIYIAASLDGAVFDVTKIDTWQSVTWVSMTVFRGHLQVAFIGAQGSVAIASFSEAVFSSVAHNTSVIPGWMASSLSLAVFKDQLYMVQIGGNRAVWMASTTTPGYFEPNNVYSISGWMAYDVNLCTSRDKLYLVHIGGSNAVYLAESSNGIFLPNSAKAINGWQATACIMTSL